MPRVRVQPGNGLAFHCPGCDEVHQIQYGAGGGARWDWNGDLERPTFTPSVRVTWGAVPDAPEDFKEWRTARCCHSFVRDGRIEFLTDSTHRLAGKTVDLPAIEERQ